MRKKIIAANWKMNMTLNETESFVESLLVEVENINEVEIVVCPPFTAIAKLAELLTDVGNVKVGSQNVYFEQAGAFTGEINTAMLRELFVRYVIIGHSERRTLFGETDEMVNKKLRAVNDAQMKAIVCVGETLEQRDADEVEKVLKSQLTGSLAGVTGEELAETVIAYEPVWAIGTGRTASPEQAQQAHAYIREVLDELAGSEVAAKVRVQYGGSVKPANAEELMAQPDIDGALVGGASLDPRSFAEIVRASVDSRG